MSEPIILTWSGGKIVITPRTGEPPDPWRLGVAIGSAQCLQAVDDTLRTAVAAAEGREQDLTGLALVATLAAMVGRLEETLNFTADAAGLRVECLPATPAPGDL